MTSVGRVYDELSSAERARNQLLQSGYPSSCIYLAALEDEAGPVAGNGVLDAKDTGHGPRTGGLASLFGSEGRTDAYNNSDPEWYSSILLTVDAEDEAQCARAGAIMDRCAAIDVDARQSRAH